MPVKLTDDAREHVAEILPNGAILVSANTDQLDAFSNQRNAPPAFVADGQLTYDLQPIIYEQIVSANGAITHDTTNRCANITLTAAANGEETYMQSYSHYRYQAGRAQEVFITGAAYDITANCEAFWRYGNANNAVELASDGTHGGTKIILRSDTSNGDQTVPIASWNIDKLNGVGPSRVTLDPSKGMIFVMDIQALYTGRVRCGFDIDGDIIWVHEFLHANVIAAPYIQTANLPVSAGIRATDDAATGAMRFVCSCVLSRGGQEQVAGFDFSVEGTVTAGSGTRTHLLSVRPRTTFNGLANRVEFVLENIDLLVTGAQPVYWELCLGQALTTPTYANVNATYSAFDYATAQTLSGNPAIVFASGYCAASGSTKGEISRALTNRYPITLNAAGAVRDMGTVTLLVTGLGGTSACRAALKWKELR